MGVHVSSKHRDIAMGYFGFQRLRRTVADLCPKEITDHYSYLLDNMCYIVAHKEVSDWYDEGIARLYEMFGKRYGKVLDFLYASDCDAEMTYGTAKQLLSVIGDYDDDVIYGYAGWGKDAARFRDFKELLQDAAGTKTKWGWS
jgi:hypothetical protein